MFCWLAELLTELWSEDFWQFLIDDVVGGICSHGADFCAPTVRAEGLNEQTIVTQEICSHERCLDVGDNKVPRKATFGCLNRDDAGSITGILFPLAAMSVMFGGCFQGRFLSSAMAGNRERKAPVSTRNSRPDKRSVTKKPEPGVPSALILPRSWLWGSTLMVNGGRVRVGRGALVETHGLGDALNISRDKLTFVEIATHVTAQKRNTATRCVMH